MSHKEVTEVKYKGKKYSWSIESFNEKTGNACTSFKPNHLNAPDFR